MPMKGIAATLAVALLLCGCNRPADENDKDADEAEAAIPVETAAPVKEDIFASHSATAAIEAYAEALVVAKVGGEIREILVEEGDDVKAGQLLARLDGDRLRLDLVQSEARLQKLRRDFQRNSDLKKRNLISAGDFEKIQYEMEALEASWKLAKLELSYTDILAPIDGVVSNRLVKTGNTIEVNAPMFQITSLEPLVAYLHLPEREYQRIGPGMPASIVVDALAGIKFDATVARVSPVVDPATGTFKITVEVRDPTRRLKPGMFARINIVSAMHADALQIPRNAVIDDADEQLVFVVADDIAHKRSVRTGLAANGRVEIVEGLSADENVVVVGHTGLRDGSKVLIVNAGSGDTKAAAISPAPKNDES